MLSVAVSPVLSGTSLHSAAAALCIDTATATAPLLCFLFSLFTLQYEEDDITGRGCMVQRSAGCKFFIKFKCFGDCFKLYSLSIIYLLQTQWLYSQVIKFGSL